jgi:glycosyltransferase involved in cell wall biosynthesis
MKVVIAHGGDIGFQGGGTNRVLAFAKALAENGYDVRLVVPKPREVPEYIRDSIKIHTVPIKPKSMWDQIARAILVVLKAKKLAEKEKAVLQIEHSTLGGIASLSGCSNYVLDIHDLEFDGPLYKSIPLAPKLIYLLEKRAVRKALKIVVVSETMRDFLVKNWNVPEDKIEIIPNGYFEEKLRRFQGGMEEDGLVSFIGVFTHNVDYDKIIRLAESREDIRIYMMGEGPLRPEFIRKIKNKGIGNIEVPGFLPDKDAYGILAKSQICINPRKNDFHTKVSVSVKNFEYAALWKAIATDRDGTAIIFEKYNAALVSDPAKPEEFIRNVHRLLDDEKLRKELGKKAKDLAKDFTWERNSKRLVKMYEELNNRRITQGRCKKGL